jgi:hypothetical protein
MFTFLFIYGSLAVIAYQMWREGALFAVGVVPLVLGLVGLIAFILCMRALLRSGRRGP